MNSKACDRIIQALIEAPGLSRKEIAVYAFVGETTLSGGGYLKAMKLAGLIHVSGWRRNATGAFTIPLYSAGQNEDCKRPEISPENRAAPGMLRLLEAIKDFGPIDYRQAAKLSDLSQNTVKNSGYLEALISQEKIHISDWRRSSKGPMRPIYKFGPGKEAPRLEPRGHAVSQRAYLQRKKAMASSFAVEISWILTSA